jgi:hypothetical protein
MEADRRHDSSSCHGTSASLAGAVTTAHAALSSASVAEAGAAAHLWRRVSGWPAAAAPAVERFLSAIALDVHLEDRGVVDEAVDGGERHRPHSPEGHGVALLDGRLERACRVGAAGSEPNAGWSVFSIVVGIVPEGMFERATTVPLRARNLSSRVGIDCVQSIPSLRWTPTQLAGTTFGACPTMRRVRPRACSRLSPSA